LGGKKNKVNLFIRNERTGSTTLYNILPRDKIFIFGHFSLKHILSLWSSHPKDCITGPLTSPAFEECFSFAFVRNPWTRLFSLFTFDASIQEHTPDSFTNWILLKPDQWWMKYAQHRYTHIDGEQKISKVYRYENFADEVNSLFERLKLPCPEDMNTYIKNGRQHLRPKDYNRFYNRRLKSYVYRKMLADIEFFGYRFEDINEKS
jgi:hypothetical protein